MTKQDENNSPKHKYFDQFMKDQNSNQISQNNFINSLNQTSKLRDKQEFDFSQNKNENALENFEEKFQKIRKKLKKLENQYQIFNYYSAKNLSIVTQFVQAEYHLNFYETKKAAQILVQILEESNFIISNYPYLILNKLNHIFNQANIKSKEFDLMFQKFNPQIYFQIGVVFACGLNSEHVFNSAKLTSDIIGKILNSDNDQLGIFLIEIQDIQFNQYMAYTRLKTVKQMINKIIGDIFRFTTQKKDYTKLIQICNELNVLNNRNKQYNIATESNKSHSIDDQVQTPYSFAFDQEEYMNKLSENFDEQLKNQVDNESNNITKIYYEKSNLNINSFSDININYYNTQQKKCSDLESTYLSPHLQVSQTNLNRADSQLSNKSQRRHTIQIHKKITNEFLSKIQNTSNNQLPCSNFDTITVQNLSMLNQSVKAENNQVSQDSFEVEAHYLNNLDRNHQFYMSIRMALKEFYEKDIVQKYQKNISSQNLNKQFSSSKLLHDLEENQNFTQQKFIIYCTDEVQIRKNYLFEQLCLFLLKYKITIIIYSSQKGQNFLELQPQQSYLKSNKQLIKVFYKQEQVIQYLKNFRDKINPFIYPTIIQHF
ncbi:hypothetical protein TTHERM_00246930 (macronuclear) [Tetrahymena thermophila SB210]|uniref:Uncharacterized protein n=1 Tax=Tetrahymena thermophila (strain SB210) TaxID=312017 RepID=Q245Q6_TETTS|nr:hypothetical protein TTHERM_00246930 [Tetrahymena thermophila SB210]EAS03577.2 hypothetical protein TTHERM_00246930 [Tetrahymena thermophila SB210]|eukprot:XP_001023822.2 hypothetical protein TTHERM_00246930 [Tetrahymena thermophila SB210]